MVEATNSLFLFSYCFMAIGRYNAGMKDKTTTKKDNQLDKEWYGSCRYFGRIMSAHGWDDESDTVCPNARNPHKPEGELL